MPLIAWVAVIAGGGGLGLGYVLSSKSSNLAVMAASTAVILYIIKGKGS